MPTPRPTHPPPPRPATRVWLTLGLFTLATTGLLLVLYTRRLPLGETGHFLYRYSNMLPQRLARAAALLPILALLAFAARSLARPTPRSERVGLTLGAIAMAALTLWTWWVPPAFLQQHSINLLSPSHEGAFLIEASHIRSAPDYLRRFDRDRLPKTVEDMRGTRILSNTPGTTLLAYWVTQLFPADLDHPGVFESYLLEADTQPQDVPAVAYAMKLSLVLALLWGCSAAFAYALGRVFLSPLGAGLFAVLVTFNPATANFVPGKDPAQLLTINAMLLAWFLGVRRRSPLWTATAGGLLVLGAAWGLIHIWVAFAALLATAWHAWYAKERLTSAILRYLIAPAAGALVVVLAVYLATGWNMPATFLAVARRYGEVQHWITYDRTLWFWIGLPLFLLFVSPVTYALAWLPRKWYRPADEGWRLGVATVAVMLLVYVVGVTYELPRLWVAFVPLLTLAAAAGLPALRARDGRRVLGFVIVLLVVNCVTTAMHVASLDARESEYRLFPQTSGGGPRLFN